MLVNHHLWTIKPHTEFHGNLASGWMDTKQTNGALVKGQSDLFLMVKLWLFLLSSNQSTRSLSSLISPLFWSGAVTSQWFYLIYRTASNSLLAYHLTAVLNSSLSYSLVPSSCRCAFTPTWTSLPNLASSPSSIIFRRQPPPPPVSEFNLNNFPVAKGFNSSLYYLFIHQNELLSLLHFSHWTGRARASTEKKNDGIHAKMHYAQL